MPIETLRLRIVPTSAECAIIVDRAEIGDDSSATLEQLKAELWQQQGVIINSILKHLGRAANLAKSAEESHAGEPFECIMDVFMEDYYDLMDPQGIAERKTIIGGSNLSSVMLK